jgi:transcription elongation factor Elf1
VHDGEWTAWIEGIGVVTNWWGAAIKKFHKTIVGDGGDREVATFYWKRKARRRKTMNCQRCNGYMVRDSFVDQRDDTGGLLLEGWRCINCGEIVDPVVLTNRMAGPLKLYRGQTRDRRTWKGLTAA